MAWLEKLARTYDACVGRETFAGAPLLPLKHTRQNAHIEITIDGAGDFLRAQVVDKDDLATLIPCTEESIRRTSGPVPHPLADKLFYVAADFGAFGGIPSKAARSAPDAPHRAYVAALDAWAGSPHGHPKIRAVLAYVRKGRLLRDLLQAGVLPMNADGGLAGARSEAPVQTDPHPLYRVLMPDQRPQEALVRWRVEIDGDVTSATWQDPTLLEAWVARAASQEEGATVGVCMVTGETVTLADNHPAKLRHGGDKAKLISGNDGSGFTYRGRFIEKRHACTVGLETTLKAHEALRWLIARQGHRHDEQTIVAWHVGGAPLPDPLADSEALLGAYAALGIDPPDPAAEATDPGDAGQAFARRLNRAMRGYTTRLGPSHDVVVMSLYATSPGRMSITFYRELSGSGLMERLQDWHDRHAWSQHGKNGPFVGAPSPSDIVDAAFGHLHGDVRATLRISTTQMLLACIVDGLPVPRSLIDHVVRRACHPAGHQGRSWEHALGVACSLVRGATRLVPDRSGPAALHTGYSMALETTRTDRDYLFGRLLALAERTEEIALARRQDDRRESAAARFMQRFSHRPSSTWQTLFLGLAPYMAKLYRDQPATAYFLKKSIDEVMQLFAAGDFESDRRLQPAFLLGYHCQRAFLRLRKADRPVSSTSPEPLLSPRLPEGVPADSLGFNPVPDFAQDMLA